MSEMREKIMAIEVEEWFGNTFNEALDLAADIAEAEVQRLEARVRELEDFAGELSYTLNLYCPNHTIIEKAERVIGGE